MATLEIYAGTDDMQIATLDGVSISVEGDLVEALNADGVTVAVLGLDSAPVEFTADGRQEYRGHRLFSAEAQCWKVIADTVSTKKDS